MSDSSKVDQSMLQMSLFSSTHVVLRAHDVQCANTWANQTQKKIIVLISRITKFIDKIDTVTCQTYHVTVSKVQKKRSLIKLSNFIDSGCAWTEQCIKLRNEKV